MDIINTYVKRKEKDKMEGAYFQGRGAYNRNIHFLNPLDPKRVTIFQQQDTYMINMAFISTE